jgi:hypothetical protein
MAFTSTNIKEVLDLMISRVAAAEVELGLTDRRIAPSSYYLIGGRSDMVVVKSPDDLFRLDAVSPDKGYAFPTFGKAKQAADRWNRALDPAQKAARCNVTVVSRVQYLEHIVTHLEELRPNMEQLYKRLLEEEAAK